VGDVVNKDRYVIDSSLQYAYLASGTPQGFCRSFCRISAQANTF
jgi:hypothetical protein